MRKSELLATIEARSITGLSKMNDALMTAKRVADAIERAPKVTLDKRDMMEGMRNFTKVFDGLYQREGARTYALVEYIDDVGEGGT